MNPIPCSATPALAEAVQRYADELRASAYTIGSHGLSQTEFENSGLFRGAIERIRGQFSASMSEKRAFAQAILNHLQSKNLIKAWSNSGNANRHDYFVEMPTGKKVAIELKGCLDGNNTNIFERPSSADEFVIWSVCTNPASDPQHNVWSGIHTRLSAEIITRSQRVDGLIVWDGACGGFRPCPKLLDGLTTKSAVGSYVIPPPCIYIFPATVPHPRSNPDPKPQSINSVEFLYALNSAFNGRPEYINYVSFHVEYKGSDTVRTTQIVRDSITEARSRPTAIRRNG